MELNYKLEDHAGIPMIRLGGRFDAEAAAFVKGQIATLITDKQPNLVIEMSQVRFVDSMGLAALVSGLKLCRKHGGIVKLVGMQPQVRRIFELTRLDQAFMLHPDVESALATFSRS
jgi:anti-sigma B factor antagonist